MVLVKGLHPKFRILNLPCLAVVAQDYYHALLSCALVWIIMRILRRGPMCRFYMTAIRVDFGMPFFFELPLPR